MDHFYSNGMRKFVCIPVLILLFFSLNSFSQQPTVAQQKILNEATFFRNASPVDPLSKLDGVPAMERSSIEEGIDPDKALYFSLNENTLKELLGAKSDKIVLRIPFEGASSLELQLIKSEVFTDEFQVFTATDRTNPFP